MYYTNIVERTGDDSRNSRVSDWNGELKNCLIEYGNIVKDHEAHTHGAWRMEDWNRNSQKRLSTRTIFSGFTRLLCTQFSYYIHHRVGSWILYNCGPLTGRRGGRIIIRELPKNCNRQRALRVFHVNLLHTEHTDQSL